VATREILSLNESTPQILAPQTGDSYLAPRTVTIQPETNTNGLVVSSGTLTADAQALDLTQTWNAGGVTFTTVKLNVTNTASASGSKLLDMQVGGSSIFSVDPDVSNPGLTITNASAATLFSVSNSTIVGNRTLQLTPAANTSALTVNSGTLTANAPALDLTQTWNNSGVTFTGIKFNVPTDSSASGSLLMDLQVGGASKFKVSKDGFLTLNGTLAYVAALGIRDDASNYAIGQAWAGVRLASNYQISWGLSSVGSVVDLTLAKDTSNTLAQRNGANAQTFRIYNTTDAGIANYERGFLKWDTNVLKIGTEKAGTGTARALELQTDGTTRLTISTAGTFTHTATDSSVFTINGANGSVICGRNLTISANQSFIWNGRSLIASLADGQLTLWNNNANDFGRLNFGGTTSSFPALKRSSTTLQGRLADDSAFCEIQGKLTTDTAYSAGAPTATGYIVLYDSTGTAYKVPAEAL